MDILQKYIDVLYHIESILQKYGIVGYVIGGAVRDIYIKEYTEYTIYDIDIALEIQHGTIYTTSILEIMESLSQESIAPYNGKYTINTAYYTSSLSFYIDLVTIYIDYAITRKDTYPFVASFPIIDIGTQRAYTIEEDMHRRDFTINTLALPVDIYREILQNIHNIQNIHTFSFGQIEHINITEESNTIDTLLKSSIYAMDNAIEDCMNLLLRNTHKDSFIEDPSRILRALLYIERYGYIFEKKTEKEYYMALAQGVITVLRTHSIVRSIQHGYRTCTSLFRYIYLYMLYGMYSYIYSPVYVAIYCLQNMALYVNHKAYLLQFCHKAEQEFLLHSILTHHSLHNDFPKTQCVYSFKKRVSYSRIHMKKRFYILHNNIHREHTAYIQHIRSNIQYMHYAFSARSLYYKYISMMIELKNIKKNTEEIIYAIALFCSSCGIREIVYLILQYSIPYKIILEEYLYFMYTKKDTILFSMVDLPPHSHTIRKELFQHLKASIFVYKLYTDKEQLAQAKSIVHVLTKRAL